MVSLFELKKASAPIEYAKVTGRVRKEHYDIIEAAGLNTDALLEAAFREVAEQVTKDATIKNITGTGRIVEPVKKPVRGEFDYQTMTGSAAEKIIAFLRETGQTLTADEIVEHFKDLNSATVLSTCYYLKRKGALDSVGEYPMKLFYPQHKTEELAGMIPVGTKTSYMG